MMLHYFFDFFDFSCYNRQPKVLRCAVLSVEASKLTDDTNCGELIRVFFSAFAPEFFLPNASRTKALDKKSETNRTLVFQTIQKVFQTW